MAILIGIEQKQASIWQIFSKVAKLQENIPFTGGDNDSKATYGFHETIINALRPIIKQGVKNIIIASPSRTNYAQALLNHIKGHHSWLFQGPSKATINLIVGSANTPTQVAALTRTENFKQILSQSRAEETENLLELLEKRLNQAGNLVRFSLEEAENLILYNQAPGKPQPEYLLLTDDYLASARQRGRINRLLQIAQNKGVKTRVISADSTAGKRLNQLGGIVTLAK